MSALLKVKRNKPAENKASQGYLGPDSTCSYGVPCQECLRPCCRYDKGIPRLGTEIMERLCFVKCMDGPRGLVIRPQRDIHSFKFNRVYYTGVLDA